MWLKSLPGPRGTLSQRLHSSVQPPGTSLFIPPLLYKMETVRPASIATVARQLNAKFWNQDNSVFQALKVQSKVLKIDCGERAAGANESEWWKWSKMAHTVCVVEACNVVYFGRRQSAENSIFPQPYFGFFWGGVLWESVLRKWSWQIIYQKLSTKGLLSGQSHYGWYTKQTAVDVTICILLTSLHCLPPFKE